MLNTSDDGRTATITLPGGELDEATARQLTSVLDSLIEDRAVRVVALVASGADFGTGITSGLDPLKVDPDPASALARLRVPVVAAITGACYDESLEVALATDIRVADPSATFRLAAATEGCIPCWGGSQRLARAIRPAEATSMMLLGSTLTADRAASLGLIHEVAADARARTSEIAEQLAGLGPLALEFAKEAVHRGSEMPLRDGLRLEGDLNHLLAATDDRAEGLAAFFDKRPPDFSGR
ncbi:MAG: enoyl-CoA hydratase/isomerase family protein [Actinomycetia bacterium]|nr:enoyl-CoA hydratase/isomerase family protein [Actinomycetes bacterium]MCP3913817.1 enoyl-CoA hydratase/isomerase family protein [Actinomycetes bacterium]MCP4083629.1 enoyl-CoA hydratase/isomerase family protein [Actinomycetes bacterium]